MAAAPRLVRTPQLNTPRVLSAAPTGKPGGVDVAGFAWAMSPELHALVAAGTHADTPLRGPPKRFFNHGKEGWAGRGGRPTAAADPARVGPLLQAIDEGWDSVPYGDCLPLMERLRALPVATTWKDTRPLNQCFSAVHLRERFGEALPYVAVPIRTRAFMDLLGIVCEVNAATAVGILRLLSQAQ